MRRIVLGTLLLLPVTSGAETDRERSFAICLTITPGLGAASLGHPGRGAANFALYTGGFGLLAYGATSIDEKGKPNGGVMAAGGVAVLASYVWAFVDGVSLEASEEFTDVLPLSVLLKEVKRLLMPGGVFVHFWPLDYHFDDIDERRALEARFPRRTG